jgi:hypothetical protein
VVSGRDCPSRFECGASLATLDAHLRCELPPHGNGKTGHRCGEVTWDGFAESARIEVLPAAEPELAESAEDAAARVQLEHARLEALLGTLRQVAGDRSDDAGRQAMIEFARELLREDRRLREEQA